MVQSITKSFVLLWTKNEKRYPPFRTDVRRAIKDKRHLGQSARSNGDGSTTAYKNY